MLITGSLATAVAVGLLESSDSAVAQSPRSTAPRAVSSVGGASLSEVPPQAPRRRWNSIVLHHSATTAGDVDSIDAAHRLNRDSQGNPWLGIGYHFVVGNGHRMADGEVRPTFRWLQQLAGAHAGRSEHNEHGIGICLVGNFEESTPTPRQWAAVCGLVQTLTARHAIGRDQIVRHQDVQSTACPGRMFRWEQFLAEVSAPPGT
jgi:hypothetical protein